MPDIGEVFHVISPETINFPEIRTSLLVLLGPTKRAPMITRSCTGFPTTDVFHILLWEAADEISLAITVVNLKRIVRK